MNAKYLLFVYMPYEKYHKVVSQPFFADNEQMAFSHIMNVRQRRELLYIDIFKVSDSLHIAKIDNQIPTSRLHGLFAEFEKAGN